MLGGELWEELREGKQAVFLSSIRALSRCKLEVQIEVDSEHAKDMF